MPTIAGREVSDEVYRRHLESYYEPSASVRFTFGGQTSDTPLNPLSFANARAAQELAAMLGPEYQVQGVQLGGPFAYSTPMQMLSYEGGPAIYNAGLVQDLVSRYGIDYVREMLEQERRMAGAEGVAAEQERANRLSAAAAAAAAAQAQQLPRQTVTPTTSPASTSATSPSATSTSSSPPPTFQGLAPIPGFTPQMGQQVFQAMFGQQPGQSMNVHQALANFGNMVGYAQQNAADNPFAISGSGMSWGSNRLGRFTPRFELPFDSYNYVPVPQVGSSSGSGGAGPTQQVQQPQLTGATSSQTGQPNSLGTAMPTSSPGGQVGGGGGGGGGVGSSGGNASGQSMGGQSSSDLFFTPQYPESPYVGQQQQQQQQPWVPPDVQNPMKVVADWSHPQMQHNTTPNQPTFSAPPALGSGGSGGATTSTGSSSQAPTQLFGGVVNTPIIVGPAAGGQQQQQQQHSYNWNWGTSYNAGDQAALRAMRDTPGAFNVSQLWNDMVAAQQRNIDRQAAELAESFNVSGNRFSTAFGNAAADYRTQIALDQNSLLGNLAMQAYEWDMARRFGAASTLASLEQRQGEFLGNLELQRQLGLGDLDVRRYGVDVQRELGLGGLAVQREGIQSQERVGMAEVDARRFAAEQQYAAALRAAEVQQAIASMQAGVQREGLQYQNLWNQNQLDFARQNAMAQMAFQGAENAAMRQATAANLLAQLSHAGLSQLSAQDFQSQMAQFQASLAAAQQLASGADAAGLNLSNISSGAATNIANWANTAGLNLANWANTAGNQINNNAINAVRDLFNASNFGAGALFNNQNNFIPSMINYDIANQQIDSNMADIFNNMIMRNIGVGSQIGGVDTTLDQAEMDRLYQEWIRTQPIYNPVLPWIGQGAMLSPNFIYPNYAPSVFGQIAGAVGNLGGRVLGRLFPSRP